MKVASVLGRKKSENSLGFSSAGMFAGLRSTGLWAEARRFPSHFEILHDTFVTTQSLG